MDARQTPTYFNTPPLKMSGIHARPATPPKAFAKVSE